MVVLFLALAACLVAIPLVRYIPFVLSIQFLPILSTH